MRNDNIARSLRYYRNVNHKSIDDIIAFLREHDYDVSEKTIYLPPLDTEMLRPLSFKTHCLSLKSLS